MSSWEASLVTPRTLYGSALKAFSRPPRGFSRLQRWLGTTALGDDHAGGAQQPIVDRVAVFQHLEDCAGRRLRIVELHHRLVQRRVESRTLGRDPAHAEALERGRQHALGGFDPLEKRRITGSELDAALGR